jgi:hypothetical protein
MKHTAVVVITFLGLLCVGFTGCKAGVEIDPDRAHDTAAVQLPR